MTPVIHVLQHPGCVPKPIPSYACIGKCTSYVQVPYNPCIFVIYNIYILVCIRKPEYYFLRFLVVKFGKWNDLATVVKNQEKERRQ